MGGGGLKARKNWTQTGFWLTGRKESTVNSRNQTKIAEEGDWRRERKRRWGKERKSRREKKRGGKSSSLL